MGPAQTKTATTKGKYVGRAWRSRFLRAPARADVLAARSDFVALGEIADLSLSRHATAALTLALCAVLVAPRRLRPVVAFLGALFAAAVAYAILILAWHFPSDVLGGFFVAATWVLGAVTVLLALEQRRPERTRPARAGPPVLWPIELAV